LEAFFCLRLFSPPLTEDEGGLDIPMEPITHGKNKGGQCPMTKDIDVIGENKHGIEEMIY
jgi:hypothetical protein